MAVRSLLCRTCGTEHDLRPYPCCHACGGELEPQYDHSALSGDVDAWRRRIQAGPQNIWRYADFLPLVGGQPGPSARQLSRVGLPAGCTPLLKADRLAERLGLREVWVKNDAHNPTHSFKDRIVAVASARAQEFGFDTLACQSTGNLGNSVAAYAAALGMPSWVFVPAGVEEEKILATGIYGANVAKVRGGYDAVGRLCGEISGRLPGWGFANHNLRPYCTEAAKTVAFEIAEQLGFTAPDHIFAPIGSGSLFAKIGRGFQEWGQLGLVEGAAPAMHGGQSSGCAPVADAFARGAVSCTPVTPETITTSLAVGDPHDGTRALEFARATGGTITAVSDVEIRAGVKLLAETTGIFTEPAGGVTVATLVRLAAAGRLDPNASVVLVMTGDGLKTPDQVRDSFAAHEVGATFDEFAERVLPHVGADG